MNTGESQRHRFGPLERRGLIGSLRPVQVMVIAVSLTLALTGATRAQGPSSPSIDDVLNLKRVGSPALSPDGKRVAYTVRETNWDENAYETEIWLADADAGTPHQLTNADKSSSQPAWSTDNRTLAFVSDRDGKRQIYRIDMTGGEAEKLTTVEEGVSSFAWSPDGRFIAFTSLDV